MNTDWIPPWLKDGVAPLLAVIIVVGGFLVIIYMPDAKTEIVGLMTYVLAYYFGSSRSSQAKDEVIKDQMQEKDRVIVTQLKQQ
jgi:uncharacterized membrane protein YfcA